MDMEVCHAPRLKVTVSAVSVSAKKGAVFFPEDSEPWNESPVVAPKESPDAFVLDSVEVRS